MGSSSSISKPQTITKPLVANFVDAHPSDLNNGASLVDNDGDDGLEKNDDDSHVSENDALNIIEDDLKNLAEMKEPWNIEGKRILNMLLKKYYANRRKEFVILIGDLMIKHQFFEVCIRIWEFCHNTEEEKNLYLHSKAYRNIKLILWNYSDKCPHLAEEAYKEKKLIAYYMKDFSDPNLSVINLKANNRRHLLKGTLGMLLNMVRLHSPNKELIRLDDGVAKLLEYYSSTFLIIKAKIMILLAYCINEEENQKIFTGTGVVDFIVRLLGSALHSPNHIAKQYLFSAEETVMGLDKLAFNDDNKEGFLMDCVHKICNDPSTHHDTLRSCDGILFVLEKKSSTSCEKTLFTNNHVMLSYQWDVQHLIIQIKEQLELKGFSVWIDIEKMEGSILSGMASAVENASVVIVAVTENYKNSNACRTEAEYAYKLSKPILPLLLQSGYKPDGWLGAFIGVELYLDFSHIDNLKGSNIDDLSVKLEGKIKSIADNTQGNSPKWFSVSNDVSITGVSPKLALTSSNEYKSKPLFLSWTSKQVQKWISEQIGSDSDLLPNFDGVALYQLYKLLHRSPDLYYRSLREDFNITWLNVLHLTDALEKLF